ncbi:MAG TPA: hypothetical protein VLT61_10685, partial [Anaeromyxobacteraceae bacterium]|nr:hypothetical protein [Anaeromyxobacteraceae bacterium]
MSKTPVITRKDMKEPDRFQQVATQAAGWIAARKRHVVVAGAVVVGLLVVVAVLAAVERHRAEKAGAAAAEMLAAVAGEISSVPIPGLAGPVFATDEERLRAVIAAADGILKDHPRGGAADLAALARGDALLRLRDWAGAGASYERFLQDAPR